MKTIPGPKFGIEITTCKSTMSLSARQNAFRSRRLRTLSMAPSVITHYRELIVRNVLQAIHVEFETLKTFVNSDCSLGVKYRLPDRT